MTTDAEPKPLTTSEFIALRDRIVAKGYRGLSEDERDDLLRRTKNDERLARELFVMLHERYMLRVLKQDKHRKRRFSNRDMEESMQEGRLVLLRAAKSFDPSRGKFSTYLFWWLRSSARKPNSGDPLIWIEPQKLGNGKYAKADLVDVAIARNVVGLDDSVNTYDGLTVGETISIDGQTPEEEFSDLQLQAMTFAGIRKAMATLSERERFVIETRFGEDAPTLEAVGQTLNITREGVRLIEIRALAKIRKHLQISKSDSE